MGAVADPLLEGRAALAQGRWEEARGAFEQALVEGETATALEGLGIAHRWLGETGLAFSAMARSYRLYRRAHDRQSAARVALQLSLGEAFFRMEPAVALGWLARAERLLDGLEPTPEGALALCVRANLALGLEKDLDQALETAREAQAHARAAAALDAEMMAVATEGLALVCGGEIEPGMRLLDEATAAAVGGELEDPDAISMTCCALIDACKWVRDFDRASQWCDQVREFCERWSDRLTFAACRAHYADVLIWRGAWAEAEAQLVGNLGPLAAINRQRIADSLVRLAELRRRQGRLMDAADLLGQAEGHWLAPLVGGELALDRGEPQQASQAAERYLRWVPPELVTERTGGLELLTRASVLDGDMAAASAAADELATVAQRVGTPPVRAAAALAGGVLAAGEGRLEDARRLLEDAADLFGVSGGRYEAARARQELGSVLARLGQEQAAAHELRTAASELSALGAAAASASDSARLSPRELEVLRLIARGRSNQEIASELFLSTRTVERHVSNIYDKIGAAGKSARAAATSYALVERIA
jgi:ATP/maltotriose-dependent transcriptional regulator MalT